MDEIGQDPKLNAGFARGRWLDVAVAVALIAAAVLAVMTGRGSRSRGRTRHGGGPGAAPVNRDHTDPGAVRPARRHDHARLHGLDLGLVRQPDRRR
jgi:hypothetical protein